MKVVNDWLDKNFDNSGTKTSYRSHLKTFSDFLKHEERAKLGEYVEDISAADFLEDLNSFLRYLKEELELSPITINHKIRTVKMFFSEQGIEIPEGDWNRLRRRKLPRDTTITDDSMGTKEEWRKILGNMHLEGKSLLLFLLSSGCRLSEAVGLKKEDLDLDENPPKVRIKSDYAKNEKPRTVYITSEAKEAIQDWLNYRDKADLKKKTRISLTELEKENLSEEEQRKRKRSLKKRSGKFSETDKIWPIKRRTAYDILNRALEKAGLDERDNETNRRKIHFHSARKFYKTNLKSDNMNEDIVEYLLGHLSGIRGVYSKYEETDIPKEKYEEHSHKLKILSPDAEAVEEIEKLKEEERKGRWKDFKLFLKSAGVLEEKIQEYERKFKRFQELRETGMISDLEDESLEKIVGDIDLVDERYEMAKKQTKLPEINIPEDLDDDLFNALKEHSADLISKAEKSKQKVVKEEETEEYLEKGWKFVNKLNDDKAIIEK